jgi:glucokinase
MSDQIGIGIDLGGTSMSAGLVDEAGCILHQETRPTSAERGPRPVIDKLAEMVAGCFAQADLTHRHEIAVGIGTPGPLSPSKGVIHHAANLPGWRDVAIVDMLSAATGHRVVLDNDANAAACGEYRYGVGARNMVVLTLGTGIGSGVFLDGHLVRGHFENAAELGHTIVVPGGLPCSCGQRGCLETYASAGKMVMRIVDAIKKGERSDLSDRVNSGASIGAEDVISAAKSGDALSRRIWSEACDYLAIACVNIQHSFNPEVIVLAGGLSQAGGELLVPVRERFEAQTWNLFSDQPRIALTELNDDAGVLGAAALALV